MPDPLELNKTPSFSVEDQALIDARKPGVFAPQRLPELYAEDFLNGLNWTVYSGTAAIQTGVSGHPGVVRLTTGASSGDKAIIGLHDSVSTKPLYTPNVVGNMAVFKFADPTDVRFNIGLYGGSLSTANFGNDSLCFELDTSINQKLGLRADTGGTATRLTPGSNIGSATWYKLDWFRIGDSSVYFYINNVLVGTVSTNVPTGACGVGVALTTLTAAAKTVDVDFYQYEHYVSQRFD